MEEKFNNTFDKYKEARDKYESLYIFVIFELSRSDMEENFKRFFKMLDGISEQTKRGYLKSRINDFKKNIDSTNDPFINGIYLVGESVKYFPIEKYYLETLKMFKVNNYNYKFGKKYELTWLRSFLLDRNYVNVVKVKNNDVSILKVNNSKQQGIFSESIKSLNLIEFLNNKVEKNIKFLIHGNSIALKQLNEYKNKLCLGIINKELSLEELLDYIDDSSYQENIKELKDLLSNLLNPLLVFGNDVLEQADMGFIKTIYCTPENLEKYSSLENLEIKLIKSSKKDDIVINFTKNYNSVLGIKYY
jgi:hypothetical protein